MNQAPVIANVEMAAAWDGHEGDMWTEQADHYEQGTPRHWGRLEKAAPFGAGDRVLDVGCGTGKSTRDTARLVGPGGSVLGADFSSRMVDEARRRAAAEGLANVEFVHADAQVHPFGAASFDAVVSSFGAMFFNDPVAAFSNIGRSVRPGGRLAVLAWRELARNEWLLAMRGALALGRDLPEPPPNSANPFGLAGADHVHRVLAEAGFVDVALDPVDEPIRFGKDSDDAFAFARTAGIVEGLTKDLEELQKAEAMANLRAVMADHETPEGVLFGTSAWLITARRP